MKVVRGLAALAVVVALAVPAALPSEAAGDSNPVPIDLGPFPTAQELVSQQYRDFLGREPTADELAADAAAIISGRRHVNDLILGLLEHATVGAPGQVTRMYKAFLSRVPERSGLRYWSGRIRSGTRLSQIGSSFATSPEFRSTYGPLSDTRFVSLVYRNVLSRAPDPAGSSYWLRYLDHGTRGTMMAQFSESSEFMRRTFTLAELVIVYQGMLLHGPDPGQLGAEQDRDPDYMLNTVQFLFGFPEYLARFAPGAGARVAFSPTAWACPGTDETSAVANGDVNGDGRTDVVTLTSLLNVSHSDRVRVFLQGSRGVDRPSYDVAVPVGSFSLAVGDVTGDGRDDVVVGGQAQGPQLADGQVYVLRQTDTHVLDAPVTYTGDAFYENGVTIGDLNNDGRNDVVAMGWGSEGPTILYQDAAGRLSRRRTLTAPANQGSSAVADLNHDGRDDIVLDTSVPGHPNATILLQDLDGSYHTSDGLIMRGTDHLDVVPLGSNRTDGLVIGDFNGDGDLDVVLSGGGNLPRSRIAIYPGRGDGTFRAETYRSTDQTPGPLRAADMNDDGRADLVVAHGQTVVGIYLQRPQGGLGTEQTITDLRDPGHKVDRMSVADVTDDGKPDIISAAHWDTCLTVTAQR